jgi:hypothetical protein
MAPWAALPMIYNALSTLIKFIIGAVLIGAVLNEFDISANQVLLDVGFTPQHIMALLREGIDWALPHFLLGAMVLIPIWVVIFLLKPPGFGK